MRHCLYVLLGVLLFQSCKSNNLYFQEYQLLLEGIPGYDTEYSIIPIKGSNGKMNCCIDVGYVYEMIKHMTPISEKSFRKRLVYNNRLNIPLKVPSDIEVNLEDYKVIVDKEIFSIYRKEGIAGVLDILSARQLYEWDKQYSTRFRYIMFLCWKHGILFGESLNCEAPIIKWFIYGNQRLLNQYYHPKQEEEWHPI